MVKIPRRQTLLKVYRNILRKAASLSVVSMLLTNTYLPYFALVPQIAHADAPPELSVSYDKSSNDLEIKVNSSSKIDYLISYSHEKNGEVILEGLQGSGDDSSGEYSKKFFLGTCSANDCLRHSVKRLIVQAFVKDLGWAREQRFVFEPNLDLSLVGKSALEVKDDKFTLEIKAEDETWLKDIVTAVPSLTPTATQGPTATPIVPETATPTPNVVVETPTVTPVIVEAATPTAVPTGTLASLNEEVSVQIVESVEQEPSLIDTIVNAILPFLGTDKPDYAPTEKAVITGGGFLPNTEYSITIFSTDEPPVSHNGKVVTTATGTFTYEYQLDGTYRPNYAVEVRDASGTVVATTTFTDGPVLLPCNIDLQGADDEPGQKDLTRMCVTSSTATNLNVYWNWDEISGSGNNSYDACSLYDTNADGKANYSVCVTLKGNPLSQISGSPRIYSCDDGAGDKCTNSILLASPYATTCAVSQQNTDPFTGVDVHPADSVATCDISIFEVGGASTSLLDVCSYPSQIPNSDPSDCIIAATDNSTPTPTATTTSTPTSTPTNSPSPSPSSTPSSTPTNTPSPSPTVTPTNSPTPSPTTTPTNSPTPSPTATNTPTATPSSTPTETPTITPTATNTPTVTPTVPVGRCGDGTVNQQSELCDDGNQNDGDYCNNNCQPNPNVCLPDVNMLSNGDFEAPVVTNGAKWDIFNIFSPFIGWIPNWLSGVTSYGDDTRPDLANIELHNNVNGWASASGSQHTELDSDWMGPLDNTTGEPSSVSLSQNLMTIPGYKYEVKFSYSPRPGAAAGDNVMKFDFGSNTETYGPVASGINWTSVTKEYVADSTPTTISFSDIGTANSEGMFLDNVSVICLGQEATPTPSATATPTSTPTPAPYCGDGIVNGDEECDGGNGARVAGASSNFCTSSCKLVPVYTGSTACSANTAPIKIGETIRVGSRDADGIALSLPSGKEYLFDVQGTYSYNINSSGNFADAAYGTNSNWSTTRSDIGIWGTNRGVTSLLGDLGSGLGVVLWDNDTTYNGDHQYQFAYTPTTNNQNFVISDWYSNWYGANCQNQGCMSDNDQGGLDLTVYECAPKPVKIVAHKIICENETYLPNWHNGANITASTAQNFVDASNGKCKFASDWEFQWGFADKTGTQGVDKLNGEILGLAAGQSSAGQCSAPYCGPNTQTGSAYNQWKTFGPTNDSGMTEVEITNLESAPGIWVRESLKSGYVPFSYPPQSSPGSNVSAEMYCHTDVANYDNFDQIASLQNGQTYYCVAFNAQIKKDVTVCKVDQNNNPLQGWKVGLSQPTGFDELIPVTNGDGINANLAESGAYVVYASGTYRYGSTAMIADAGYSYRPIGIPYGIDGWVSGDDLLSVPGALELKIAGANIQWGGFNAGHEYSAYLTGQPAGNLNLAIWDDNYGDNANNGNFRASIDKQIKAGFVGENGCVTFSDVPYGDYNVFEAPVANWSYVSTTVGPDTITSYPASVTVGDKVPEITLKNKFVGTGIIRIVKDAIPNTDTQFDYTLAGPAGTVERKVWEGNPSSEGQVLAGSYTLTETDLSEYIESISCTNNQSSATNTITFTLNPNDDVTCTITNTKPTAPLHVNKFEDKNGDGDMDGDESVLSGWTMEAYDNSACTGTPVASATTEADGVAHILGLFVGNTYWVKEVLQTGWVNTTGNCRSVDILNTEINNRIGFGNFAKGDMEVMKYEDTDDVLGKSASEEYIGDPTFTFRVYKDTSGFWTKVSEANTDSTGKAIFTDVFENIGNYFVCEVKKEGWEEMRSRHNPIPNNLSEASDEYPVCDGIIVTTSGYMRYADFGNINKGKIKVYKFHDLDGDGKRDDNEPLLPGWNIFMDKEGADGVTEQVTDTNGGTEFTLTPGSYVLGETMQDDWYQSNIYCENDGEGVKITQPGYAYGHHGACSGWNTCGNAQTCALKACQANGYSNLVSYGDQRPCTGFTNCSLFYNINSNLSYQANWGNWCNVMGVTDIVCNNGASVSPTPSSSPSLTPSPMPTSPAVGLFNKLLGVNDVMAQPAPDSNTKTITVAPGERTSCYIGNYQKATVTVNKDVQTHRDTDVADDKKFEVSGGEALGTKEFSEVTPAVFTLDPGSYSFNEVNIPEKYKLKSTIGDEDSEVDGVQVVVTSGENASITFVNKKVKPNLTIRKFNDKWPSVQGTGSSILYSIVVKILDNDMQDVAMIDLPPEGFRYQSGTWKAYKNGAPFAITEPVYSSPGTWYLGDLAQDDEVLLTYTAKIDNGTGPGLYKDMAWAYGCSETESCEIASEDMLLASSVDSTKTDPGIITDTVVGTKIEIPRTGTQSKAINIVEKREGQVLGASDMRLPATGANDWVLVTGLLSTFAGLLLGLIYFGKNRMRKISAKFVTALLAILVFASLTSGAQAANLTVRINEPKSPTYDSFDLGFVTLDIMNRPVTAKCYIQNTNNGGSYTQFDGDKLLKSGGDSEICKVTTGLLTNGSNKFKVEVVAGADSSVSQEVNIDFVPSSSGPWKPKSYGRNDKNDCDTEISFATADDGGRTVRVEAYRSTETEFTLNDGTKIASFDIGSGQSKTFTDSVPDCAKNYYYALRAFDAANNASEHIGDSMITVVNSTTTTSSSSSSTTSGSGAIEVLGGSNIPGGTTGNGQILGEETGLSGDISGTPSVTPMVTGEVLGEDESTPTGSLTEAVKEISNTRGLWFIIGFLLVAAGAGVFAYYRWTGGGIKSK